LHREIALYERACPFLISLLNPALLFVLTQKVTKGQGCKKSATILHIFSKTNKLATLKQYLFFNEKTFELFHADFLRPT